MNSTTERFLISGPAGQLEVALDRPGTGTLPAGLAVVAHPHPLFGGTLDNKVAQTIARAFVNQGVICLRPNFRGVGRSESSHDNGYGEVDDLWAAWAWLHQEFSTVGGHRWIGGFSFGAVTATHLAQQWPSHAVSHNAPPLDRVILVGLGMAEDRRPPGALTAEARLIHGEDDEIVALKTILNWTAPQHHPVLVIPGASHFFHAKLPVLKECVKRALLA